MTRNEQFEHYWARRGITAVNHVLTEALKEAARDAWNARLSEEDRETCLEALGVASREARSHMANGRRADRIWAIGAAKVYEYARRRLRGDQ